MKKIFYLSLFLMGIMELNGEPPRQIPKKMYNKFTMNKRIPVSHWYRDDSYSPKKPIVYRKEVIDKNILCAKNKEERYYKETDRYLYSAMERYLGKIKGKEVAVIGSVTPWYESIVLAYGGHPTTIEYNRIVSKDARLKILTVEEYKLNPIKFDAIISISSFEHDGLGRYGDKVDPNGDLRAMKETKAMLKKGGVLLLAVPIGIDRLWWNVHRIYGSLRFPLLTKEWRVVDSFGFKRSDFKNPAHNKGFHQPIFVLE